MWSARSPLWLYFVIRRNPSGHLPEIHESAYVDQTAILCGKVVVQENVFIVPYGVIRADKVSAEGDMEPIMIGAHSSDSQQQIKGPDSQSSTLLTIIPTSPAPLQAR